MTSLFLQCAFIVCRSFVSMRLYRAPLFNSTMLISYLTANHFLKSTGEYDQSIFAVRLSRLPIICIYAAALSCLAHELSAWPLQYPDPRSQYTDPQISVHRTSDCSSAWPGRSLIKSWNLCIRVELYEAEQGPLVLGAPEFCSIIVSPDSRKTRFGPAASMARFAPGRKWGLRPRALSECLILV